MRAGGSRARRGRTVSGLEGARRPGHASRNSASASASAIGGPGAAASAAPPGAGSHENRAALRFGTSHTRASAPGPRLARAGGGRGAQAFGRRCTRTRTRTPRAGWGAAPGARAVRSRAQRGAGRGGAGRGGAGRGGAGRGADMLCAGAKDGSARSTPASSSSPPAWGAAFPPKHAAQPSGAPRASHMPQHTSAAPAGTASSASARTLVRGEGRGVSD